MLRLAVAFVIVACALAPAVLANANGAPTDICKNDLTPNHGLDGQNSPPPYSFSGAGGVHAGDEYTLTLSSTGSSGFLGFAVQARDDKKQTVGQFKIIETNKSQTLTCSSADDTVTHKKISKDDPIKKMEVKWIAPKDFKGKVRFVGTVAMDGATYWIRKVVKDIEVA